MRAAAFNTFFVPISSSSFNVPVCLKIFTARLEALNSTGSVTRLTRTANPKTIIPLHKKIFPVAPPPSTARLKINPIITSGQSKLEAKFVTGIKNFLFVGGHVQIRGRQRLEPTQK